MTAADRYNPERFRIPFSAEVAKSVDAVDSKSTVEIRAGSIPAFGTIYIFSLKNKQLSELSYLFCLSNLH